MLRSCSGNLLGRISRWHLDYRSCPTRWGNWRWRGVDRSLHCLCMTDRGHWDRGHRLRRRKWRGCRWSSRNRAGSGPEINSEIQIGAWVVCKEDNTLTMI